MIDPNFRIYDLKERRFLTPEEICVTEIGEFKLNNRIVMQNIGIKDIYNRSIFEYDIVRTYHEDCSTRSCYYIKYIKSLCKFNIDINVVKARNVQVVGNIFTFGYLLQPRYVANIEKELGIIINK